MKTRQMCERLEADDRVAPSKTENCVAGWLRSLARQPSAELQRIVLVFRVDFFCVHAKQFFLFLSRICSRKSRLESLPQFSRNRWRGPAMGPKLRGFRKKLENFLALKIYDFVFSYERSEYAELRKKLM